MNWLEFFHPKVFFGSLLTLVGFGELLRMVLVDFPYGVIPSDALFVIGVLFGPMVVYNGLFELDGLKKKKFQRWYHDE